MRIRVSLGSRDNSAELIKEPLIFDIKDYNNILQALELARDINIKNKINSTFFLNSYRLTLLRHYILIRIRAMPRKSDRLSSITGSVIEYGNLLNNYIYIIN